MFEHLLILASTSTSCVSVSAFASLLCVPVSIASSAVGIKLCAITAEIKKYKSIIKKREKKKHGKTVLLGKDKLNTIELQIQLNCDHTVAWEDFSIIGRESNRYLLETKESLFIKRDNPSLNRNKFS